MFEDAAGNFPTLIFSQPGRLCSLCTCPSKSQKISKHNHSQLPHNFVLNSDNLNCKISIRFPVVFSRGSTSVWGRYLSRLTDSGVAGAASGRLSLSERRDSICSHVLVSSSSRRRSIILNGCGRRSLHSSGSCR